MSAVLRTQFTVKEPDLVGGFWNSAGPPRHLYPKTMASALPAPGGKEKPAGSHRRRGGPGTGFDLVPRSPSKSVQIPSKANSGRLSSSANHTTSFFFVSRFGSGAYLRSYWPAPGIGLQASTSPANAAKMYCEYW